MLFQTTNNTNLSRKEREKLNRKMEILSAAVPLFAEKGYDNTTIDDIAENAEFGKGTIYNYFESKEDIYWEIHREIYKNFTGRMEELDEKHNKFYSFIEQLTQDILSFCVNNQNEFIIIARYRTNLVSENPNLPKFLLEYNDNTDTILIDRINRAIKSKEIKNVDPRSFIFLYMSMIFPYIYKKMFCKKENEIDISKETKFIVNILFNGINKMD